MKWRPPTLLAVWVPALIAWADEVRGSQQLASACEEFRLWEWLVWVQDRPARYAEPAQGWPSLYETGFDFAEKAGSGGRGRRPG